MTREAQAQAEVTAGADIHLDRQFRRRKLDRDQIRDLVARYDAGETVVSIAARLDVAPSAVVYHAAKRTVLRRDRPLAVACGTRAGYQRHRGRGTPPCPACTEANRVAARNYQRTRRDSRTAQT